MSSKYQGPEGNAAPYNYVGWSPTNPNPTVPIHIKEVQDTCVQCLNREEGICQAPGLNSGRFCSDSSPICDRFDRK